MSSKGGAGSGGTTTTQTNSTSGPPQWAQQAGQQLYGGAQSVAANTAPTQIAGVAPLTGNQQSLIGQLDANVGGANGTYSGAINTLNGLQGFNAPNVNAGQLSSTDLSPYLNPYTKNVIDSTNAIGRQALGQAISGTGATAAQSGAFGGSRQGVQEGVANSQYALGSANTNAQLQAQNFAQAQGAASSDIGTRLAADTTNAGNAINSAGLRTNAANSAVSAAGQQQSTYLNGLMAALGGEGMVQGNQQAQLQQTADQANANNMAPYQRILMQQGVLQGIPMATTTNGTQTAQTEAPAGSTFGQILGGGLGLLGTAGAALGPMGFGLTGAAGLANGLIKK